MAKYNEILKDQIKKLIELMVPEQIYLLEFKLDENEHLIVLNSGSIST